MFKALALTLALAATPALASAQSTCDTHETITTILAAAPWAETLHTTGDSSQGFPTEIWVNHQTGTWTVLYAMTPNRTCIVATGSNWAEPVGMSHGSGPDT